MAGGSRGRCLIALAAVAALAVAGTTLASGAAVPVTFKASSTTLPAGKAVTLTATAKLAKGNRLVIQRSRLGGKPVNLKECAVSPCRAAWSASDDDFVTFQAIALKRAGKKTTVLGKSRTIGVTWATPEPQPTPEPTEPPAPPTPPAPPAPAATPGHYEGRTSQNEIFAFDVSADGGRITGLHTGQINESCDPPDYYLSGGNLNGWAGPVGRDGSFVMSYDGPWKVDDNDATEKISIAGRIANGSASGTILVQSSWAQGGTTYNCSSGDQTWSATKVG